MTASNIISVAPYTKLIQIDLISSTYRPGMKSAGEVCIGSCPDSVWGSPKRGRIRRHKPGSPQEAPLVRLKTELRLTSMIRVRHCMYSQRYNCKAHIYTEKHVSTEELPCQRFYGISVTLNGSLVARMRTVCKYSSFLSAFLPLCNLKPAMQCSNLQCIAIWRTLQAAGQLSRARR